MGCGGRLKREGTHVYFWLIHTVVWQKPAQHCKAIIFQLKINLKKEKFSDTEAGKGKKGGESFSLELIRTLSVQFSSC